MLATADLSSRESHRAAFRSKSGFEATTRTEFCLSIASNFTRLWLSPVSPESMIFSSSVTSVAGRPVVHRVNTDGLTPEPVDIKIANGVERRLAFRAGAEDKQDLAARVRADSTWPGLEPLEQFNHRLAGDILERNDRQAVSRLGPAIGARAVDRSDRRVGHRENAKADGVPNQQQIIGSQSVFEDEQHVALGDRTPGR